MKRGLPNPDSMDMSRPSISAGLLRPLHTNAPDIDAMAVPKSKVTKSRRGMRRAHDRLAGNTYVEDADSGELRRPHHIDLKTGMYRGRQILEPKDE